MLTQCLDASPSIYGPIDHIKPILSPKTNRNFSLRSPAANRYRKTSTKKLTPLLLPPSALYQQSTTTSTKHSPLFPPFPYPTPEWTHPRSRTRSSTQCQHTRISLLPCNNQKRATLRKQGHYTTSAPLPNVANTSAQPREIQAALHQERRKMHASRHLPHAGAHVNARCTARSESYASAGILVKI